MGSGADRRNPADSDGIGTRIRIRNGSLRVSACKLATRGCLLAKSLYSSRQWGGLKGGLAQSP